MKVKGQSSKNKSDKNFPLLLKNWIELGRNLFFFSFPNAIMKDTQWIGIFLLHCVTFPVPKNIILVNHKCFWIH